MHVWVGTVLELLRRERQRRLGGDFSGFLDRAFYLLFLRREHHFSTVRLQQLTALQAHACWHGQNAAIAAACANQGQSDAGVAAGRFDNDATGHEFALTLGAFEPTSGNTGIGLALVCASRGYRCILTMPASMSLERRQLLQSYGAEVVLTPEEQQIEGAIEKAREIAAQTPLSFTPQQFENSANPDVHFRATSREIIHALAGEPVHAFVAAVGTGGTISGVGRVLRERFPACRIVAVEPESCATISRGERGPSKIQGIAAGFVPKNYDASVPHEVRTISDERAYKTKRDLARREGLLTGISAGANVAIALDLARELGPGKNVVTILCDTGERYFSLDEYFKS